MLGGQKSPYKLLVRAVNQHTGIEVPFITFVASEDFVVSLVLLVRRPVHIMHTNPDAFCWTVK